MRRGGQSHRAGTAEQQVGGVNCSKIPRAFFLLLSGKKFEPVAALELLETEEWALIR
jgi:hypothetical protein